MKKLAYALLALLLLVFGPAAVLLLSHPAMAATVLAAAASATWSPGQVWIDVQPYLHELIRNLALGVLAIFAAYLRAHYKVTLSSTVETRIADAVANAAGRIMASQDATFASMKVPVGSKLIEDEIPLVLQMLGKLAPSPAVIAALIQGEIGRLQAQASSVAPTTVLVAPGAAK